MPNSKLKRGVPAVGAATSAAPFTLELVGWGR